MSDEARVKALRSLTQSVTALSSQGKDRRIAELQRKLESKDAQLRASEEEWKAREAELEYQLAEKDRRIAELEGGSAKAGMSQETLDRVEEQIRMM